MSLEFIAKRMSFATSSTAPSKSFRTISIVISAYNEALNINKTLQQIIDATQNVEGLTIYIGSDGSTDETDMILSKWQQLYSDKVVFNKYDRIGKGNVLNSIIQQFQLNTKDNMLVFMDANILLQENTIQELHKSLCLHQVGIVGATVLPLQHQGNTEERYINKENRIKYLEGKLFGSTIGVFGACFAMRGDVFRPIPAKFITDDLYLSFIAIENKFKVITSTSALVLENITADVSNEFQRKQRYGAGNFQIFFRFIHLLFPVLSSVGFVYSYVFHKLIRWTMPLWMLLFWIISFFKMNYNTFYVVFNSIGIGVVLFLLLNYSLFKHQKRTICQPLFYFLAMNIALLIGFFKYLKGINTNVWNRSKRD